jgi:hypothetical protein
MRSGELPRPLCRFLRKVLSHSIELRSFSSIQKSISLLRGQPVRSGQGSRQFNAFEPLGGLARSTSLCLTVAASSRKYVIVSSEQAHHSKIARNNNLVDDVKEQENTKLSVDPNSPLVDHGNEAPPTLCLDRFIPRIRMDSAACDASNICSTGHWTRRGRGHLVLVDGNDEPVLARLL